VSEEAGSLIEATTRRDALVKQLKARIEERGGRVVSVDSTLGV
jgi:hypothetical protein